MRSTAIIPVGLGSPACRTRSGYVQSGWSGETSISCCPTDRYLSRFKTCVNPGLANTEAASERGPALELAGIEE